MAPGSVTGFTRNAGPNMNWSPVFCARTSVAEVHHQRPHRSVALVGRLPGQRVDVGQQAVAQTVKADQDLLRVGAVRPQFVLIGLAGSMHAEDRAKGAELKPADKQLAIGRVVGIARDESADVGGPVGNAGESKVQAGGNLAAKAEPVGVDVARPRGDGIALRCRQRQSATG